MLAMSLFCRTFHSLITVEELCYNIERTLEVRKMFEKIFFANFAKMIATKDYVSNCEF